MNIAGWMLALMLRLLVMRTAHKDTVVAAAAAMPSAFKIIVQANQDKPNHAVATAHKSLVSTLKLANVLEPSTVISGN